MRKYFHIVAFSALSILISSPAFSESMISLEGMTGSALVSQTWLRVHQAGERPIYMDNARYQVKPFEGMPYFSARVGLWKEEKAWELEVLNMNLYLDNPCPEIQEFEISQGYTMIMVNRAWRTWGAEARIGGGIVMARADGVVRGQEFDWDDADSGEYIVGGPAVQAAIGKRFYLAGDLFLNLEGKTTLSQATTPVANGEAYVPCLALHGLIGLGYDIHRGAI